MHVSTVNYDYMLVINITENTMKEVLLSFLLFRQGD